MVQEINTVIIHTLVLDDNNDVTLFCEFQHEQDRLIYLSIGLRDMDNIFRQIGAGGMKMIDELAGAIQYAKEYPIIILMKHILGLPLVIDIPGSMLWMHPVEDVCFYGG